MPRRADRAQQESRQVGVIGRLQIAFARRTRRRRRPIEGGCCGAAAAGAGVSVSALRRGVHRDGLRRARGADDVPRASGLVARRLGLGAGPGFLARLRSRGGRARRERGTRCGCASRGRGAPALRVRLRLGFGRRVAELDARDFLADQLLDRGDRLAVGRSDQRDRGAGTAGAAGAADAMHIVVGMMRHVEIEDVADGRNVEAAGGDVGRHQQIGISPLRNASSAAVRADWSMSPCMAPTLKPCFCSDFANSATSRLRLQNMMAFLRSVGVADQLAQRFALLVRLATGGDHATG